MGMTVHLTITTHHLTKRDLKSRDGVEFHGKGQIERAETRSTPGKPPVRAALQF
jgi:hypothetical protein